MKKIAILSFFCSFIFATEMAAQPTLYFFPEGNIPASDGDQVCVEMRTVDFTDLLEIRHSINWNPDILTFVQIQNINPAFTNATLADFDTSPALITNGQMTFDWDAYDDMGCEDNPPGLTLDDDVVLYELCFDVSGIYGGYSPIEITDDPLNIYVTRENTNCSPIGLFTQSQITSVAVDYTPVTFNVSSASGQVGDNVCVQVSVEDFNSILSMQFSINFDPTVLDFVSFQGFNLNGVNVNSGDADQGNLNFSWFDQNLNFISLPDGTVIVELCFEIIGDGGDVSEVTISGEPVGIEIVDEISQNNPGSQVNLTPVINAGEISVDNFDSNGIFLNIDDREVCVGEEFCLDVTVEEFSQIREIYFSLNWNPNVLQFDGIQNIAINNTSYPANFETGQLNQGRLGFEKDAPGTIQYSLSDGETLMSICFTVIGNGGSTSVVAISNDPQEMLVIQGSSQNEIGINTNSSLVTVKDLAGITITSDNASGFPGDEVCVDYNVIDFEDITEAAFPFEWNTSGQTLDFSSVTPGNVPGLTIANFDLSNSSSDQIIFDWTAPGDPVTLANGTTLFTVCYIVTGPANTCSEFAFPDEGGILDVQNETSAGQHIGLNNQTGEVCVDNPNDIGVQIGEAFAPEGVEVCIPVSFLGFTQLTNLEFSINWDFDDLQFVDINYTGVLPSFDDNDFDLTDVANGNIIVDWTPFNSIQGETVADDEAVFELCFITTGDPDDCISLFPSGNPQSIFVTAAPSGNNNNLGLTGYVGTVCITGQLSFDNVTSSGVDCPGAENGSIDLAVSGGNAPFSYQWSGPSITPANENALPPLMNITNGTYGVTITDQDGLLLDTTIIVGTNGNAPVADAGPDVIPPCGQLEATLDGTGSTGNGTLEYFWSGIGGCSSNIMPGDETSPTPTVFGNCTYLLQVTETSTGCVVFDTVEVIAPNTPLPIAGPDLFVDCVNDTAFIDADVPVGNDYTITWTAIEGTIYSEIDSADVQTSAGIFAITLVQDGSGCVGSDTVEVVDQAILPIADAGTDATLGCTDVSVSLDASASVSGTGESITFEWMTMSDGDICSDANLAIVDACGPGEYMVVVTDESNGCTASDIVLVEGDTLKPVSNAGPDLELNCLNNGTVTLDGTNSAMGDTILYQWMSGGMMIDDEITTEVTSIGTYTLIVTNESNGCSATSTTIVTENLNEPVVTFELVNGGLDCNILEDTIFLSTNIPNPDFNWDIPAMDSMAIVTMGGTFNVTVTDTENGCNTEVEIEVEENTTPPDITAGDDMMISCTSGEVVLNGSIISNVNNPVIQWSNSGGAGCFSPSANVLTPEVSCQGMYILLVQDPATGCIATDTAMVMQDATTPVIIATSQDTVTCAVDCGTLSIELDDPTILDESTIVWTGNGGVLPGETGASIEVCEPGTYEIVITHNTSGCTDSAVLEMEEDFEEPANVDLGPDTSVDCDNTTVTLDGSPFLIAGETSVQWFDNASPANPVGPVDEAIIETGAGTYILVVTNLGNGCTASDDILVNADADIPVASAGPDVEKGCTDTTVTLDGSNSDPGNYEWTNEAGDLVGTEATIDVTDEGTYTLTVIHPTTGCSASDQAIVTFNINLPDADAMADAGECDTEGFLIGNLPTDATGVWTALESGLIVEDTVSETTVTNLSIGENCFVWSLSSGTCENYSSDTACVNTLASEVDAIDDDYFVLDTATNVMLPVFENDLFGGDVLFTLVENTDEGTVDTLSEDGVAIYNPVEGFVGETTFTYSLCNIDCPNICDTATVFITIDAEEPTINEIPNGITPNGDGVNDAFVFDLLLQNPERYPNREFIVFNRWGDIVFEAQPYENNWEGTNNSGDALPEGTYYYILRLEFGLGEILRGDVTIVR